MENESDGGFQEKMLLELDTMKSKQLETQAAIRLMAGQLNQISRAVNDLVISVRAKDSRLEEKIAPVIEFVSQQVSSDMRKKNMLIRQRVPFKFEPTSTGPKVSPKTKK